MRRRCALTVVCAAGCFAGTIYCQIRINEIMFDPLGDERSGEFVEIINTGEVAVNLEGWCLGDGDGSHRLLAQTGAAVLGAGEYAVIFSEAYFSGSHDYDALLPADALLIVSEGNYLGSRGFSNSRPETIVLTDSGGAVHDSCRYSIGNDPGFSDERVDPLKNVWLNGCTLHGTPGFVNSIHAEDVPGKARLQAVPECISRTMSGLADVTEIGYSLPMLRSYIIIRIFTLQGRCIRSLTSGCYTGSSGCLVWDGLNDAGIAVPSGIYLVYLEGLESGSGKRAEALCPITVFTP